MKHFRQVLSSVNDLVNSTAHGWGEEDLPHRSYVWVANPSDKGSAHELVLKELGLRKDTLFERLTQERVTQAGTYEQLKYALNMVNSHGKGALRTGASFDDRLAPSYLLVKRSLELLADIAPRTRLACALLLDHAVGRYTRDTKAVSELLYPGTSFGHYFTEANDSNDRPTLFTTGPKFERYEWTLGGEGTPGQLDGNGKSSNGKYGWKLAGRATVWLGEPVRIGEAVDKANERTGEPGVDRRVIEEERKGRGAKQTSIAEQDETYLQWLMSGACTSEHPHTMTTAETASMVLLTRGEALFSEADDQPSSAYERASMRGEVCLVSKTTLSHVM